jgi:hypothetical protein
MGAEVFGEGLSRSTDQTGHCRVGRGVYRVLALFKNLGSAGMMAVGTIISAVRARTTQQRRRHI